MKSKFCSLIICIVLLSGLSFAQNEVDALRYSYLNPSGSARYNAMGTSFGAIGADASAIQFNPAGLGIFRSSEFSFTSSFFITNTESTFLSKKGSLFGTNTKFDQFSYVSIIPIHNSEYIKSVNLSASYNKINKFNENIMISGNNPYNSITDWFAEKGANTHYNSLDEFYSFLAWEAYLIDATDADSTNYTGIYYGNYGQKQTQVINRSGSQGEYNFALAFNIQNKLFIGSSLGVQTLTYIENKKIEEIDEMDVIPELNNFNFREFFETNGSGVNLKIGAIFAPKDWIRLGASVHTPTFLRLNDQYQTSIHSSSTHHLKNVNKKSKLGLYDYKLMTPFKVNASLGFIVEKQALINIDYEYVDYSTNKFSASDGYTFIDENQEIKSLYKGAHNIKLGMEYRYGPIAFRLGTAYLDSPYKSSHINRNASSMLYSGGLGIKLNKVNIDLAYSYLSSKDKSYFMYSNSATISPESKIKLNRSSIFLTVGFKI